MKIKHFLLLIFLIGLVFSIYGTFKWYKGEAFQKFNKPIKDYQIVDYYCFNSASRGSSSIKIEYKNKYYYVGISSGFCKKIKKGEMTPKFYYINSEDEIFFENQYFSFGIVTLIYIITISFPLFGFIFWRKELDNHYSTM